MAVAIYSWTDSQGRACSGVRKVGEAPPGAVLSQSDAHTTDRADQVLARAMIPIGAARGTTRSSIVHMPAPSRAPGALTDEDRAVAKIMGLSEADLLKQRAQEARTGRWTSGPMTEGGGE